MRSECRAAALLLICSGLRGVAQTGPGCRGPRALEQRLQARPTGDVYASLGTWFGDKKLYSCAAESFRAALRLNPQSARLHYFLGLNLYSSGQPASAIEELATAVKLDPAQVRNHLTLGAALHDAGHEAEALQQWDDALRIDPDSVTALDWIAKARISEGQYTTAIDLLRSAPRDEELTLDLTLAYTKAGMFDDAISALQSALEADSSSFRLNVALATVFVQRQRYEDAAAVLRNAQKLHPDDTETQQLYLRVLVMMGDAAHAQPLAAKLLAANPKGFDALYLTGVIERDDGNYAAARDHLQAAAALDPNHYDVRFNLGAALAKLHQPEAAREQLVKAIELDGSEPEAHFQLSGVFRALGDPKQAAEQLRIYQDLRQSKARRDLASNLSSRAAQALATGDPQQAVRLYREAQLSMPDDATLDYNLAMALDRAGDFTAEVAALQQSIQLKPSFAAAENQLGYLAARSGDSIAAEQHFHKALDLAPQFAEAENNLGTLLGEQGHDREAERYFLAAVSTNPRFTQAWINLAATRASDSRFDQALQAINSALLLEPANSEALKLKQMLSAGRGKTP